MTLSVRASSSFISYPLFSDGTIRLLSQKGAQILQVGKPMPLV
jgi:hypothetical protein